MGELTGFQTFRLLFVALFSRTRVVTKAFSLYIGELLWRITYSTYKRGGDARRKFWIKPLKETDLGVAQAFFDP